VLRSGLRRLGIAFGVIVVLTSALSAAIGALAHANIQRSIAVGFYVAGVAVLIGCFVLGLRGPLRMDWGEENQTEWGGGQTDLAQGRGRSILMPRSIRRATPDERVESKRNSLALFALGIVLIFIAAGFDPRRHAF
jgi:Na+/H+ antiporter NhaC